MENNDNISFHYINLDKRDDRRKHMENEIGANLPDNYSLVRWPATSHSSGWIGCIHSHCLLLKHLTVNNSSNMYCVLEDDCVLNNKKTFKHLLPKYINYLKKHSTEWDLFLGGGIYAVPVRIVSIDPFIIECDWITCAHFVIYNNISANKAITFFDNQKYDTCIDNHNARSNRRRIWVPYPTFCDQLGTDTDIGNFTDYTPRIMNGFKDTHRIFNEFVKKNCKLLLAIPGFGGPQFDFKKSLLTKNIDKIRNTFNGTVDITLFNYGDKSVDIQCNEIMQKGYVGQFIYKHLTPDLINKYHFVLLLLDDIELDDNINIDTIIRNYTYYNLDIISPSLNTASKWNHQYMLQLPDSNKIRFTQCLELFFYLMKPSSYTKWYNLLDQKSNWLWGIDYAMYNYNIAPALMDGMTITHHIKNGSYSPDAPNPYDELDYNRKRLRLQHQVAEYKFVEMV
jgi:hypothetical protein